LQQKSGGKNVDDLERIIEQIKRHGIGTVARETGLPFNTVKNVIERRNPTYKTMLTITQWLEANT